MTGPQSAPPVERRHPPRILLALANPVVRRLAPRGVGGKHLLVLHYRGRRTGRSYDVPAGYRLIDGVPCVLTNSGWRLNFRGGLDLDVTFHGRRRPARGSLVEGPDEVAAAYDRLIRDMGVRDAQRRLGLRFGRGRAPTLEELRTAVRDQGLGIIRLDLDPAGRGAPSV